MGIQDRDWYWEDRDRKAGVGRKRAPPLPQPSPPTARATVSKEPSGRTRLHPATSVALFILGALLLVTFIATFVQSRSEQAAARARQLARQLTQLNRSEEEAAQASIKRQQQDRQAKLAAQETERIQTLVDRRRATETLAQANADEREKAWASFYHPSPACSVAGTVACANEFIRARRAFESKYRDSPLSDR